MERKIKPISPEEEVRKEVWLKDLAKFIVEANAQTWAAEGAEVTPQRPGYKELEYPPENKRRDWYLRDSYTGYFRAPGMSTVYYKDKPVWTMSYGGHGQTEDYEDSAKETFNFLQKALMKVTPEMPYRGPKEFIEEGKKYTFRLLRGDLTDCLWEEEIHEDGILTFTQIGFAGLVIKRDSNKQPFMPWNL